MLFVVACVCRAFYIDVDFVLAGERNNAGIALEPYKLSMDGIEMHFATNHVGMSVTFILISGFVYVSSAPLKY